jgi:WD40 repeat protein
MEWAPLSGSTLAVGVRHGVCVWRTASPTALTSHTGDNSVNNEVTSTKAESWMTFLPCGSNGSPVTSLTWCPEGKYLATGSNKRRGAVRVWDVDARTVLRLVDLSLDPIRSLRWSPKGGHLAGKLV